MSNPFEAKIEENKQAGSHLELLSGIRQEVDEKIKELKATAYDIFPEWRTVSPKHAELRKVIEALAEEKGVSVEDIFPDYSSGEKVETESKKSGRKTNYDPNDPETFTSAHWKSLGLNFKTFPKGEYGTIVDKKNGQKWNYNGRGALPPGLKEFRHQLFREGATEIPYED